MSKLYENIVEQIEKDRKRANQIREKIFENGIETAELDAKDWIIIRLLYALYKEGRNAEHEDARKATEWLTRGRKWIDHSILLLCFAKISAEEREKNVKSYEPYWRERGKWE